MKALGISLTALLLAASPGFAQTTTAQSDPTQNSKVVELVDQLKAELKDEPVEIGNGDDVISITSSADSMFQSGGWELTPGVPVLRKIVPSLSKLQHTWIVVSGYTDDTPIGAPLQSKGVTSNLELSCKRAGSVVANLVSQGVNPRLISIHCFGATRPVAPNDTPEGQAKNRRVAIVLSGDGT